MATDEKLIVAHAFTKGGDSDSADQLISPLAFRRMLNLVLYGKNTQGIPTKKKGNTLIPNILPAGNNKGHGWGKNEELGKLYFFNYNDQCNHGLYAYDIITQAITPVLLNKTDTNGVDIMQFDPAFPIYHFDIVGDQLAYWCDGLNKARKTNLAKCIDKSSTGYGTVITEDLITAYKQCAVFAPTVEYFTDLTRTSNYVYALQFKFCTRFYYADGEISNASDFSAVALPPNESYLGQNAITFDNNGIKVSFETGSKDVTKIELLVKIDTQDFVSCIILNKAELGISDYASYTYSFYNDGAYNAVDALKIARPYSYLPRVPYAQAFVKTAMLYANFNEGFAPVKIIATAAVTFTPFYLPSGTVSQLNNPAFTFNNLSVSEHGGIFNSWWTTVTHFVIGADVKKGNVFSIVYTGGNGGGQYFKYTANVGDSALTVANQIKQYLRTIDAVGTGTISNEVTDGSGNVSWDFTIEAHEGKPAISYATSVTPVNYSTLLDNGLSINTIKQGSSRKYGIVYEDDDGRTSLTYTNDNLLVNTPFETETILGSTAPIGLQQPIHTIQIFNQPPQWAKYWRLVRTSDTKTFIQMLIQQATVIQVANEDTYLDLIVGSLFTYQKIHPDTILTYDFERGDRLRLISNENTTPPTPYTPYFETEVLGYTVDEETPVNANITTTIGTPNNHVTPSDGVKTGYVGKNIIIQDVERTIVSISGADYVLDEDLSLEQSSTPTTYVVPNYTIVDRRGVLRIKNPQGYSVADQSLVEIYRPQQNLDNTSYLDFFDFQQKFAISDWGTPQAAHVANIQNQDGNNPATVPAIVQVTNGDAYVRNRALPSNNENPNPQVIIDQICDPNFSDFYQSNLYNTGRVYPQDQAYGVVKFGSRVRFSNNYIEDTRINGLNDFDNTDRKDYNDPYGFITLLRFKESYLYVFKQLRTAWTPVGYRIIKDNNGNEVLATSDELLNELKYALWNGGIGNNPECYTENGSSQYIVSTGSGVILRIAQDGSIPISSVYLFDKKVRDLLSQVNKYNLRIPAGFDRPYDDALWSVDDYIQYLFNNNFNAGDWQTAISAYPAGTTFAITQQPAHSTATVVGNQIQITGTSTLGNDFFKFQGTLPDSSLTPVMNFCFTVIDNPNKATIWTGDTTSKYCLQVGGNNTGDQNFKVLNQRYQVDNTLVGFNMPNIAMIDPLAIVPNTNAITFNPNSNPTPAGGSVNDIWYNAPADQLYKNIGGGIWQLLTNRVINANYIPPVQNATDCPFGYTLFGLQLSNSSGDICGKGLTNVYAASGLSDIAVGTHLFIDSALTTPLTGFTFVVGNNGHIYNLNTTTGVVGTDTGSTCTLSDISAQNNSSDDASVQAFTIPGNTMIASFPVVAGGLNSQSVPAGTYKVQVTVNPTAPHNSQVTVNSTTKTASSGFGPTILVFNSQTTSINVDIEDI